MGRFYKVGTNYWWVGIEFIVMEKIPDKVLDLEADVRGLLVWIEKLENRVMALEIICGKAGVIPPD